MIYPQYVPPADQREMYLASGAWSKTETLAMLLAEHAVRTPEAVAVADDRGTRLTYAELDRQATGLASSLVSRGIEAGDTIGIQMPNRAEASVILCAAAKLGATVNPMVPMYREREIVHMSEACSTKALVVPDFHRNFDYRPHALNIAQSASSVSTVISVDEGSSEIASMSDLIANAPESFTPAAPDPDAISAVIFTSGTEALPKGALHTENTLLSSNRALQRILDLGPDDAIFMASPVGHATGFGFALRLAIFLGSKVVLQESWDPLAAVQLIEAEQCTYTHASTPFALDLLRASADADLDLSSLRYFVTGGATVPSGLVEQMQTKLGCQLLRLYGMTEAFMNCVNPPQASVAQLESYDGLPPAGVEMAVSIEDTGERAASGTGEALVRGPHRCLGFVGDPERTRATISEDGWLKTGDIAEITPDGYVKIVGRKKEVINRGGYKYSPREIEDLLQLHPQIKRIAIVRITDDRLGEKACAVIVPEAPSQPSLEEIAAHLKDAGVAPYKWPEDLRLVDDLPMTASGKVKKFVLEQQLANERNDSAT